MHDVDDAQWKSAHEAALPALRSAAWYDASAADPDEADAEMRRVARRVCDAMAGDGARPERVIVRLKRSWAVLPEAAALDRTRRGRLLEQLVSLCIDEYFRPAPVIKA